MLARLRKLPALVLDFVEQPHVLDRDHRLVGEGLDQLDLLIGERPHFRTRQYDHANRNIFAQQRHAKYRAKSAEFGPLPVAIFGIGQNVLDLNDLTFDHRPAKDGIASRHDRTCAHVGIVFAR